MVAELKSFLVANFFCNQREMETGRQVSVALSEPKALRAYTDDLDSFFDVFNALPNARVPVHLCRGRECCASREDLERKASLAMKRCLLRHLPPIPPVA